MHRRIALFMLAASLVVGSVMLRSGGALAAENGNSQYPEGVESLNTGSLPPPGIYLQPRYNSVYSSEFLGENKQSIFPPGGKFAVSANAFDVDFLHVTGLKLLGGNFFYVIHTPYLQLNITTPFSQGSKTGLSDIAVVPSLAYPGRIWNYVLGVGLGLPTGSFTANAPVNLGTNYFQFEPNFVFSYYGIPNVTYSSHIGYDFNETNHATNYRTGQELHMDYDLAYVVSPSMQVGVAGYVYRQATDDYVNGQVARGPIPCFPHEPPNLCLPQDGFKGRVWSIGPLFVFPFAGHNGFIEGKAFFDQNVVNRPSAEHIWISGAFKP